MATTIQAPSQERREILHKSAVYERARDCLDAKLRNSFERAPVEDGFTHPAEDIIAEAFGRIPWAACRDPRIDRWLASHLLDRLRAGDSYEAFWQAVIERRAPTGYRVWEEIADDPDLPAEILFRASQELGWRR